MYSKKQNNKKKGISQKYSYTYINIYIHIPTYPKKSKQFLFILLTHFLFNFKQSIILIKYNLENTLLCILVYSLCLIEYIRIRILFFGIFFNHNFGIFHFYVLPSIYNTKIQKKNHSTYIHVNQSSLTL